jgi:hypothetical protein
VEQPDTWRATIIIFIIIIVTSRALLIGSIELAFGQWIQSPLVQTTGVKKLVFPLTLIPVSLIILYTSFQKEIVKFLLLLLELWLYHFVSYQNYWMIVRF